MRNRAQAWIPASSRLSSGSQPHLDVRAVLAGVVVAFLLTVLVSAVLAFIIYFTEITEAHVSGVLYFISLVAMALGGMIASKKAGMRGWLHGGLAGIGFVALSFLLAAAVFPAELATLGLGGKLLSGAVAGAVGGIIGINA